MGGVHRFGINGGFNGVIGIEEEGEELSGGWSSDVGGFVSHGGSG